MAAHGGTEHPAPAGAVSPGAVSPGAAGPGRSGPGEGGPGRVFLHIGEPKTGTTFLQQVMWGNRAALKAQGLVLPGHHPQDHFRASQDLRGIEKLASDPAGSWTGEWDILATQARQAPGTAVISHELFSAADEQQAERAVTSLSPAEVHLVLTVRDMASLLPAEWQETVKHRSARGWEDWLGDVIDSESVSPDRRQWWFWRVHDTQAILALWSRFLPAGRIHVITMPPPGAGPGVLWDRFAGLVGLDPAAADLSCARPNASLGTPETEFLRRLNQALPAEVPDWFYMWTVKEGVAHRALASRPRQGRLVLPAGREAWAKEQGEALIGGLSASGYDIIGDLGDLRPRPAGGAPAASPGAVPDAAVLDAAVEAAAALVANQYQKEHGRPKQAGPRAGQRGLAGRVESAVAASPRLKRTVRDLSSRHPAVRRLRILAWQAMERSRPRSGS